VAPAAVAAAVLVVMVWPAREVGRVLVAGAGLEIDGQKAVVDQPILEGSTVTARDGDSALIVDADRGILLRKGAVVAVSGPADVSVLAGRARFAVKPGHGPFAVRSGAVRVEVVGTIFVVDRREAEETLVAVHRGTVNVTDPHGKVQVKDGQECLATAAALSPARPAGARSLEEDRGGNWLQELWARLAGLVDALRQAIGE
jgi:ferric-dicitrate binding protein FerR (iron transport regulator)